MNILIADDQKLLRESFKYIIENNSDIKVIGCVVNGKEAYDFCCKNTPDLILMDITMPVCNGTEATKLIKQNYPLIKVLILTASSNGDDVAEAISNGADGYIVKDISTDELILSIKSTAAGLGIIHKNVMNSIPVSTKNFRKGKSGEKEVLINGISVALSEKELKIISLIVDGYDNKQIGSVLFMAEGTVKNKITDIISKLQLKDRTQLAVFALKNKLMD
ncbi:response regulator transcription factor [Anaerocolumna sp. AGMB13025]|uniref:response regulator transcription factor n=1 Tax=Anaerocolumna sp. AGMB13025 TaxID=3039116 RepID=UPI00241F0FB4|nr:response regulator transcription factor [Anaerocolumna sp. AGMB13025]WFR57409.1 response regulator transcription factor [Anaerocolumna sp. AGMB13025]